MAIAPSWRRPSCATPSRASWDLPVPRPHCDEQEIGHPMACPSPRCNTAQVDQNNRGVREAERRRIKSRERQGGVRPLDGHRCAPSFCVPRQREKAEIRRRLHGEGLPRRLMPRERLCLQNRRRLVSANDVAEFVLKWKILPYSISRRTLLFRHFCTNTQSNESLSNLFHVRMPFALEARGRRPAVLVAPAGRLTKVT